MPSTRNSRINPFDGSANAVNIVGELHTIEFDNSLGLYGFYLTEIPLDEPGFSVTDTAPGGSPFTILRIPAAPLLGQCRPAFGNDADGYRSAFVWCNPADDGVIVTVDYIGLGFASHETNFRSVFDVTLNGFNNLISNGFFETPDLSGWVNGTAVNITQDVSVDRIAGTASGRVSASGQIIGDFISHPVTLETADVNQLVHLSIDYKFLTGSPGDLELTLWDGLVENQPSHAPFSAVQGRVSVTFRPTAPNASLRIKCAVTTDIELIIDRVILVPFTSSTPPAIRAVSVDYNLTGIGSDVWPLLTGNSVTLPPGVYELMGFIPLEEQGASRNAFRITAKWSYAAATGPEPGDLTGDSDVDLLFYRAKSMIELSGTSISNYRPFMMNPAVIRVKATKTIFLNMATTHSGGNEYHFQAHIQARRIRDV